MEPNFDKESFIRAYDQYSEAIFRYCYFKLYDRELAKEVMQECFTRTWEYLSEGKKIDNVRAFLYKVAHNLCVNDVIKPKSYSLDEMSEKIDFEPIDTARSPEETSEVSILLKNLQKLRLEERELLTLRYVEDLPITEIAAMLDLRPNTATVKLRRAEEALKKIYYGGK